MMGPMSKALSLSRRKEYHLGYSSAALRPCGAHLSMRPPDRVHIHVRLKASNKSKTVFLSRVDTEHLLSQTVLVARYFAI